MALLTVENLRTTFRTDDGPVCAVDGVSLTAFDLTADTFSVAVIPHTTKVTTLGVRKIGDQVNIEMDMMAKHIERMNVQSDSTTKSRAKKWWRR